MDKAGLARAGILLVGAKQPSPRMAAGSDKDEGPP